MEKSIGVEITVKLEPANDEEIEKMLEITDSPGYKVEEEKVWIKQEPKDEFTHTVKIEVDADLSQDRCDEKISEIIGGNNSKGRRKLVLPLKKRIGKEAEEVELDKGSQKSDNNEQSTEKVQPTEDYSHMYSYEIIKNIQIVTIDEEERQIEHRETLGTRQHMRHVCEYCAVGFVVQDAFLMHMKIHSPESGSHECEICHSFLKTADMLYRHRLRHYRRYRCLVCAQRFKDKDSAACHVMTDHERQSFNCSHCGREFKRPQYMKRHVEQYHTKPRRLECPVCSRVFHERGWYRSHVRTHNEEVKRKTVTVIVTCDVCSRNFRSKAGLKRHLESHEAPACRVCRAQFPTRGELEHHYLSVHNQTYKGLEQQECALCGRVCATRAMLRHHMRRMHTDRTKKYQCDHCQRLYLTKGEVRSHISWSHQPPHLRNGHPCSCGREFRTPALLRDHRARFHSHHPPPRNHHCDLCGKAFQNKQVLNRHKKSHSNEMYPCNECGLLFKTQPYVKVHYQIKHMNMTRAQIREQAKLNRSRIPQNNIHRRGGVWEPSIPNGLKDAVPSEIIMDPLEVTDDQVTVEDVEIKVETEDRIQVPLFETFANITRD